MIELVAAAVSGAVVGGGVVWWRARREIARWMACCDINGTMGDILNALRANCFIPDERGVKVRYSEASVARRVKAETPKEVV